jgi:SAM-dependent methyltransferase
MTSDEWSRWRLDVDLSSYDDRWARMAASGQNPHGEVDLVMRLSPSSVLDAGCGTGRVAIELARRDVEVVGVDLDDDLLAIARRKAPELTWISADLAGLDLGRAFDVVVAAGNVIGFVEPADRIRAVARCAAHLAPGGHLVVGYQLRRGWPTLDEYDAWCADAALVLDARFATWEGDPLGTAPDYAVSVHRATA